MVEQVIREVVKGGVPQRRAVMMVMLEKCRQVSAARDAGQTPQQIARSILDAVRPNPVKWRLVKPTRQPTGHRQVKVA